MNYVKFFKSLVFLVVTSQSFTQLSSNECMEQLSIFAESAKIKNYEAAYEPWKSVLDNCPKLNVATYQFGERILKDFISKTSNGFSLIKFLNIIFLFFNILKLGKLKNILIEYF